MIAALQEAGLSVAQIKEGLSKVKIPGRVEKIKEINDCMLYIDYAHNGMSLKNVLQTFRLYHPKRLVVLFGCGGNRDKGRRFEMGKIAGMYADFTVITMDNPRFESPDCIVKDIEKGIKKTKGSYRIIYNRKEAIRYVLMNRTQGDIIVIAGKGHETYQEINGIRYKMDDRELISEVVKELNNYNNR